jgi:zinc transport system substrate-binding protein
MRHLSNLEFIHTKILCVVLYIIFFSQPAFATINICVTIKPLHDLVSTITAGIHIPSLLIEQSTDLHTYQLKPSDMRKLQNADIVFLIHQNFEQFSSHITNTIKPSTRVAELSKATNLEIKYVNGKHSSKHPDYHIWLSPINAKLMLGYITHILSKQDPVNQARYQHNHDQALATLNALDNRLKSKLSSYHNVSFITTHNAYQYFTDNYQLNNLGSVLNHDHEHGVSGQAISAIDHFITQHRPKCIFTDPHHKPIFYNTLRNKHKIGMQELDAEWGSDEKGLKGYIALIENLADNMISCLK